MSGSSYGLTDPYNPLLDPNLLGPTFTNPPASNPANPAQSPLYGPLPADPGGGTTAPSTAYPPLYGPFGSPGNPTPDPSAQPTPYYSPPQGPVAPGVGPGGGSSGVPGYGATPLPASASGSGWLSLVEELAVRVMLGLVGMVLLLAGFYVAGQRSGLAPSSVGRRLSSLSS